MDTLRLFWARYASTIAFLVVGTSILVTLLVVSLTYQKQIETNRRLEEQSQRIEEQGRRTYRLSLCIALIQPINRTPSVIDKCLEDGTVPPRTNPDGTTTQPGNIFDGANFTPQTTAPSVESAPTQTSSQPAPKPEPQPEPQPGVVKRVLGSVTDLLEVRL